MGKEARATSLPVLPLITAAALAVAVLWLYWPVLARLVTELADSEDYSYGLLIPLVSGYLVYLRWPQIRGGQWRPSWLGLGVMGLGMFFYLVGELAAELYTIRFSFVVVLTGIVWLHGGYALVRLLAFPLLLLFLTLPLPELITYKLTLPLQLISSSLAAWFLRIGGVPVLQQGNIIDLGVRQLQIVAACSGLRYILALVALGVIYCYFYQRRPWKVAVLMVALIPAAIFANALRVAGMGVFPVFQVGFWHTFSGWLIFLFCFGILICFNWLLNRLRPGAPPAIKIDAPAATEAPPTRPKFSPAIFQVAGLALVLLAIPVLHRAAQAPPVPLKQSFDRFPMQIGTWQGQHAYMDPKMIAATRSHAHLNANFTNPDHGTINLWIAYYETQKKAGGFVHSPKGCLTASGWNTVHIGVWNITPGVPVNYMEVEQMGQRLLVYYWFMQRGRWLTSEYENKLYMGWDGLVRRRTDGAIVRLVTPLGGDLAAARERLSSFAGQLAPVLPQFIPD